MFFHARRSESINRSRPRDSRRPGANNIYNQLDRSDSFTIWSIQIFVTTSHLPLVAQLLVSKA